MVPVNDDAQRWLSLHASGQTKDLTELQPLTFECRCTQLTSEGRCAIWEDRPIICEVFIAGSRQCLSTVKLRRTPEQYQLIRDKDDPDEI